MVPCPVFPPPMGSPGSRSARLGRALQAAEDQLQRQAVLSALIRAVHSAPVAPDVALVPGMEVNGV